MELRAGCSLIPNLMQRFVRLLLGVVSLFATDSLRSTRMNLEENFVQLLLVSLLVTDCLRLTNMNLGHNFVQLLLVSPFVTDSLHSMEMSSL